MNISIITINYNHNDGLSRTVNSIINQKCKDFEWIIIDGGSIDGSVDTIKSAEEYIDYWSSEKDNGIYHAMNKGAIHAHGEYLLFLNSGDYLYNEDVISQVKKCRYETDIIIGDIIKPNNHNHKRYKVFKSEHITLADILLDPVPHQSTFIKKELLESVGFYDESYKIVSDWKFFIQTIIFKKASVSLLDYPISVFEGGGISVSNDEISKKERKQVLEDLLPCCIIDDYVFALSLKEVYQIPFTKHLYSVLYRLSRLIKVFNMQ